MSMFKALAAPFDPDRISWRVGSLTKDKTKARALAYIDARDVMERLDAVCGAGGWQAEYPHVAPIIVCRIALKIDGEWVWKANGAGQTDIEGEKGGSSDAFKRAAVLWGVGRYLYDIDSPWVRVDEWKQIEKDELPRLRALLPKPDGNGGALKPEPEMSKANAREPWKKLAEGLRQCPSLPAIDDYLSANAEVIATMPYGWRSKWADEVAGCRQRVSERRAA